MTVNVALVLCDMSFSDEFFRLEESLQAEALSVLLPDSVTDDVSNVDGGGAALDERHGGCSSDGFLISWSFNDSVTASINI